MTRSVDIEIKGNNSASPAFAEVASGLRKIADETRALREEEKLEAEQQRKLTELIKADRKEKEEWARQQQKLTDLIKADHEARAEAIRKEGQAVEQATLGPYERYLSAQFKLADLRKKGAISEAAHAAALEQEKQKYLQLAVSAGKVNPIVAAKAEADKKAKEAVDEVKEAEERRRGELQRTGDAIRNSVLTPHGHYVKMVRELNKALRDGAIDQKTHASALRKAAVDYQAASGGGLRQRLLGGTAARIAGPLAATFGAAALTNQMRESFTELDALAKRSDKFGIDVAELQKLEYAAGQSGVEVGQLEGAVQKYVKQVGLAEGGNKKAAAAFAKLGIGMDQLKRLDLPDELKLIADRLAGVSDEEERLRITMTLFGDGATEMVHLLGKGSDALDKLFKEREGLGGMFNREDLAGIEAANDSLARASLALSGAINEAAIALAPVVEDLANSLTEWMKHRDSNRTRKEVENAKFKEGSEFGSDIPFANAGYNLGLAVEKWGWQRTAEEEAKRVSFKASPEKMAEWRALSDEYYAGLDRDAAQSEAEAKARAEADKAANKNGRIDLFGGAGAAAGMLNKAAGDGASLLGQGTAGLGMFGPAANKWLRNNRGEMEAAAERANERVKEEKKAQADTKREAERAAEEQKREAERIRRENRTPQEIFAEEKKKAEDLGRAGLLTRELVDREIARAGKDRDQALDKRKGKSEGIPEPLQAVVSRTLTRGPSADPGLKAQQDTAKSTKEVVIESKKLVALMKEVAAKPPAPTVTVAGAT